MYKFYFWFYVRDMIIKIKTFRFNDKNKFTVKSRLLAMNFFSNTHKPNLARVLGKTKQVA